MAKRTALVVALTGVTAAALLTGRLALLLLVIAVGVAATGEMYRLLRSKGVLPSAPVGLLATVGLLVVAYVRGERAPNAFPAILAGTLGLAFVVMLWRRNRTDVTRAVAYTLVPVLTVGLLGAYVMALRSARSGFRLAWVFALMALGSELGAAAFTWFLRRRAITPRAHRTWERFVGAAIGTLLAAVIAVIGASPPFTWSRAIILALLVAASAALGDLVWAMVESDLVHPEPGIRRARAVVLRGIDGVLLAAPVFFYTFRVLAR
ncbi:MAG: phosphatidate cytidylyltransferase [Actinomycetota bacterium]